MDSVFIDNASIGVVRNEVPYEVASKLFKLQSESKIRKEVCWTLSEGQEIQINEHGDIIPRSDKPDSEVTGNKPGAKGNRTARSKGKISHGKQDS